MKKLLIVLLIVLGLNGCREKITYVRGKIMSHNVTSDKYGYATYRTIINCSDGWIREKTGLEYYTVPVGDSITVKLVTYE